MGDGTPKISKPLSSKYLTPCRTFGLRRKSTPQSGTKSRLVTEKQNTPKEANTFADLSKTPTTPKTSNNEPTLTPETSGVKLSIGKRLQEEFTIDTNLSKTPATPKTSKNEPIPTPGTSGLRLSIGKRLQEESTKDTRSDDPVINDSCEKAIKKVKLDDEETEKNCQRSEEIANSSLSEKPLKSIQQTSNDNSNINLLLLVQAINKKVDKLNNLKQTRIYAKKHNINDLKAQTDKWKDACKRVLVSIVEQLQSQGKECTVYDIIKEHNINPETVDFNCETMDFND